MHFFFFLVSKTKQINLQAASQYKMLSYKQSSLTNFFYTNLYRAWSNNWLVNLNAMQKKTHRNFLN